MTNANNVGTASLDFNKTPGKQSLSFGYMSVLTQLFGGRIAPWHSTSPTIKRQVSDATGNPVSGTGDAFASFMAGAGNGGIPGFNALPATSYYMDGIYLQDDWKASRKLTLNLGFRYEVQTPFTERHNWQAAFDFNALNPISASGYPAYGAIVYSTPGHRDLYQSNWDDVAPRIGFAYAVMPKLVFRGGFGVYYSRNFFPFGGIRPQAFLHQRTGLLRSTGFTVKTTLANAFATDADILPITGNALQGLTYVGQSLSAVNQSVPIPASSRFAGIPICHYSQRHGGCRLRGQPRNAHPPRRHELRPTGSEISRHGHTALNTTVTNPFADSI